MFNRYRIKGILTTASPLYIGSGETIKKQLEPDGKLIEVSAVVVDYQKRAYVPGTAIKGNMRSWLKENLKPWMNENKENEHLINEVFGSENTDATSAVGGKVEFHDALVCNRDYAISFPYWDATRLTGMASSVAINRKTRTAENKKLFHQEFVPPGVSFELIITGQNLEEEEVSLLLFALEQGFSNVDNQITMGSGTGNKYGRFKWDLKEIAEFTAADVRTWLNQKESLIGYNALIPLLPAKVEQLKIDAIKNFTPSPKIALLLKVRLLFDGPFLINNPGITKKAGVESNLPDRMPLRDEKGLIVLPAKSIRGAIRSQAEKILRTLNPDAACQEKQSCEDICNMNKVNGLCPACYLFGAPGWKSPVNISDFKPPSDYHEKPFHQEMVAIDRFTGGGAKGLKFNATAVYKPVLEGTISVELCRIYKNDKGEMKPWELAPWSLWLLALTLRDLAEGDIPFGYGDARGYAVCKATIQMENVGNTESLVDCKDLLKIFYSIYSKSTNSDLSLSDDEKKVLHEVIAGFKNKVINFKRGKSEGVKMIQGCINL